MINKLSQEQMQKVLNGEDILFHYKHECGNHYEEKHWKELSEKEQMLVRKWVRFMFTYSKRINHNRTSYSLKHDCESDVGFYVHNDSMKKAFLLEGYLAETGKINWYFNANGIVSIQKQEKFRNVFKEEIEELQKEYHEKWGRKED